MNSKADLKRIYHPYWLWEDYKAGFYNNCSGKEKEEKIKSVIKMFNNAELTEKYMNRVIKPLRFIGIVLFLITLLINVTASLVVFRKRKRSERILS